MTSPTSPENRTMRRRRGMRRSGGMVGLSLLATTGLFGAYLGSPRVPRAYAQTAAKCGSDVTNTTLLNNAIDTFLLDPSLCDTINITGDFALDATLHPIGANNLSTAEGAITIAGNGHSIDGGTTHRGIIAFATGGLTLSNLTLKNFTWLNGDSTNFGGAVYSYFDLHVNGSTFTGNFSPFGGAIAAKGRNADLTITGSRFDANSSLNNGGAVWADGATISGSTFTGNSATAGGSGGAAFFNTGAPGITDSYFAGNSATHGGALGLGGATTALTITGSTFSANSASSKGGAVSTSYRAPATVTNSTFTGNSALNGGALHLSRGGAVSFSTITANSASHDGGGLWSYYQYSITASNSIIAGNTATNEGADFKGSCYTECLPLPADFTLFTSNSSALITDNGGNLFGAPALGALGSNGGVTVPTATGPAAIPTMLPLITSPAIDAANPVTTGFPATDQRGTGFARVRGDRADMGAIEAPAVLTVTVTPYQSAKSIKYGYSAPTFSFKATAGSPPVKFTGTWTTPPTCTAQVSPPTAPAVGTYPVVCSGGVGSAGERVRYVAGSLTVTPAYAVTVTPSGGTWTSGQTPPPLGYTTSGFKNGDTFASPGMTAPICTVFTGKNGTGSPVTVNASTPAGTYYNRCSGAATSANYVSPVKYGSDAVVKVLAPVGGPTVTGVKSTYGSIKGGTFIHVYGSGFVTGTSVTVGGVACTKPILQNAGREVDCTTGAHPAGLVSIVVTTPNGSATLVNGYRYQA